jgi:hypothetical protein
MIWQSPAEKKTQVELFRRHVNRPGYLLAFTLRRQLADVKSKTIRARNRILNTYPTSQTIPAASLEQAMEHVLNQAPRDAVRPPSLLDAPVKVATSLVLALRTPELRPLLWRYLADVAVHPATARSLPSVLEDLLKLAIVYRIRGAKLPGMSGVEVTVERSPAEVVLRSLPAQDAGRPDGVPDSRNGDVAALRRVTWDHSAIGSDICWPLPTGRDMRVSIGEPGRHVHEFRSLPRLAARFPAQIARALP